MTIGAKQIIFRIVLGVLAACQLFAFACQQAKAQTAFYQASEQEIAGPPGTLIRQEPMFGAPDGASAYRVLYRSTSPDGRPIAVSGVIIVPIGPVPEGGRPIIAWAHPTTGIVPRCAPSLAIFIFQQIAAADSCSIAALRLPQPIIPVSARPGPHPYLVGDSEARAVIDSVRLARSFPGVGNGNRYAVWGHSQGGQASLFTGLISKSYAPELRLVGVAAAAPATDLATLMTDDLNTSGGRNLTAMTLWSWERVFGAPMQKVVAPDAMPTVNRLAGECIESIFDIILRGETSKPLAQDFLTVTNPAKLEPWRSLLVKNTPGTLPSSIPVFLAQGSTDGLVRPQVTQNYMQRLCRAGSRVSFLMMPNVGHGFAGRDSANAATAWMVDRFAGDPAPSSCGSR